MNLINYLLSLKNSRPCRDLNLGHLWYQANMLPTELSSLGYLYQTCDKSKVAFQIQIFLPTDFGQNILRACILQEKWLSESQVSDTFYSGWFRFVCCVFFLLSMQSTLTQWSQVYHPLMLIYGTKYGISIDKSAG